MTAMMDIVRQTGISEAILLFLLLFLLPVMTLLLLRLRKYETLYGDLPEEKKPGKKKKKKAEPEEPKPDAAPAEPESAEAAAEAAFRAKPFMTPADRACLAAMREALGDEVEVYPKVAFRETVEPAEPDVEAAKRLDRLVLDFLVCDKRTGKALTAVMFNPGRGRPAAAGDEVRAISGRAGANVVFIDMAEKYDAKSLKNALGIPDLDL